MSTAAGYFRIEYRALNRKDYNRANGSVLYAKAKYFTAPFKGGEFITVNMPQDRAELLAAMDDFDTSITRHNGSLGGTFQLSHNVGMAYEHRKEATMLFLQRMTQFKTRAVAGFHDQDTHNPHAHVWIYDKTTDTGEPIAFLNVSRSVRARKGLMPNAVDYIRYVWEDVQNKVLEKHGYDFRVDRRSNLERGLEQAGKHRGYEASNDNELAANDNVSEPSPPPPEVLEEPPTLEELDNDLGRVDYEEELAAAQEEELAEPVMEVEGATLADNARLAASACFELRSIRSRQNEIRGLHERFNQAEALLSRAEAGAAEARRLEFELSKSAEAARDAYMQEHRGLFGKKGFRFKAFGLEYVSPARKAADAAEAQYNWARVEAEQAEIAVIRAAEACVDAKHVYDLSKENVEKYYGTEKELAEANEIMSNTIDAYIGDLSRETILAMGEDGSLAPEQVKVLIEELGYDQEQSIEREI